MGWVRVCVCVCVCGVHVANSSNVPEAPWWRNEWLVLRNLTFARECIGHSVALYPYTLVPELCLVILS